MTTTAGVADDDGIPALTVGVRRLILSGELFRLALANTLRVGPSDLVAMGHLYNEGPLTPRELAARMEMTSGTMTALLDRVATAGFLTRSDNPKDRRSLLIAATPAGLRAIEWVNDQFDAALRQALIGMPEVGVDQLDAVLTALCNELEVQAQVRTPGDGPGVARPVVDRAWSASTRLASD
jgi:DNA-binding MarR family transcriptional regulator